VIVVESKGLHLKGNDDTTYKQNVGQWVEKVGKQVTWQQLGEDFKDHLFRFQVLFPEEFGGRDWKDELKRVLAETE